MTLTLEMLFIVTTTCTSLNVQLCHLVVTSEMRGIFLQRGRGERSKVRVKG